MRLSQIDMKRTGAFQSVYDWFSGKSLPSVDNLFYLSKILKVPMEDMIEVVLPLVIIDYWWNDNSKDRKRYLCTYYTELSKYMNTIQLQTE